MNIIFIYFLWNNIITSVVFIPIYQWIAIDIFTINFGLLFDTLSSFMLSIVCTISWLVHIYSIGYMSHDPYHARFIGYLSLFTFYMLVLVTSDNFVQLFIGWEGVGLCSHLLLIFDLRESLLTKQRLKPCLWSYCRCILHNIYPHIVYNSKHNRLLFNI